MGRAVEMATGQLQNPSRDIDTRNAAAGGISLLLSATVKRTKNTLARIERNYLSPLLQRAYERQRQLVRGYPDLPRGFRVVGTLGITAKEMETSQLIQIMAGLPDNAAKLGVLKLIIQNSALTDKQELDTIINMVLAQALMPAEPEPPSLADQARLMSAEVRAKESEANARVAAAKVQLELGNAMIEQEKTRLLHERQMIENSINAELAEATVANKKADSIKKIAEAESAEAGAQLQIYNAFLEGLSRLEEQMKTIAATPAPELPDDSEIEIERDPATGLAIAVGGRPIVRDERNLIRGVE
jgi:hypothetical protein